MVLIDLRSVIREVPDFPKKGILFYDITTLVKDGKAFNETIERMYEAVRHKKYDKVAGIESRGFIFAAPLALKLGIGLVLLRKPSKLPAEKMSCSYDLEYGTNTIEMHKDAVTKGERVLLIDDLLATGGTMDAGIKLVEQAGGKAETVLFLIELCFLDGRKRLGSREVISLIKYDS